VMREYWGNAEATAEVFRNGWYRSGDVGYRDEDGFLFIHDRKRDIIISGGENIYPAEIEGTLNEHPGVVESAVVGREDAQWGEVPVAFIITRSPETATPEALKAYLQQRLARFKHPKEFRFLATLPRNTMGKVLRYELRALALESVDS
jgi:fatty-acyl-CoA synthase